MTNQQPIENALDADLRLSRPALQRAALRAHELARQTGTAIVISKNGFIERISPLLTDDALRVHEQSPDYLK
jgi:hypothetical protein